MLHQIWEIAVARERIKVAWETIAGSGAAPPLSMFLERRERGAGNRAVRLCLTGQVMEGRGLLQVCVAGAWAGRSPTPKTTRNTPATPAADSRKISLIVFCVLCRFLRLFLRSSRRTCLRRLNLKSQKVRKSESNQ